MKQLSSLLLAGLVLTLFSACAPTRYPPGYQARGAASEPVLAKGGYVKRGKPYQITGKWYYPLASGDRYNETGVASWYGKKFHGRKTANGETYNMYAMTAAHTTLPMPSVVLVTNLDNGKQVKVRVNDRGPFVKSRLIDLSYSAAKALGYTNQGTARVRVQTLGASAVKEAAPVAVAKLVVVVASEKLQVSFKQAYVQVGAFSIKDSADRVAGKLRPLLKERVPPLNVSQASNLFRVRIGPFDLDEDALKALEQVKAVGYKAAMVIHD